MDYSDIQRGTVGWLLVGAVIVALVAYTVLEFIGAVVAGLFLYYGLRPVYRWLDTRIDHPDVNATITLLVVGLPIILLLGYVLLMAIRQADQLLRTWSLDQLRSLLRPYVDIASLTSGAGILALVQNRLPRLLWAVGTLFSIGIRLFVILTVAFYLLRDDQRIADWFRETFDEYGAVGFVEGVDDDLTTIYTGNLLTIVATSLIAVAVLYGLDFIAPPGTGVYAPLVFGLLMGIATLVPAVGMKIVYFPYSGYLVWQSYAGTGGAFWYAAVFFLATFIIVDALPDIFVRSYISRGGINMGLMMLTYIFGAVTFGWYGVFLAPLLLVLFLHFARRVVPNLVDDRITQFVSD